MAAGLTPASNAARIKRAWPGASGRGLFFFAPPPLAGAGPGAVADPEARDGMCSPATHTPGFPLDRLEQAVELIVVEMAQ